MDRFVRLTVARIACCVLALAGAFAPANAEVSPIASIPSAGGESEPTQTMFWKSAHSLVVLILIPGGEGHFGLRPDQTELRNPFYQTLRSLSNPQRSAGNIDVVIFDSPARLDQNPRGAYPFSRGTDDHMSRIEAVVR